MSETILIALFSLVGTLVGTLGGIIAASKLTNFRIEQLERKVEKHNSVIERTFKLEEQGKNIEAKEKEIESKIEKLARLHEGEIL